MIQNLKCISRKGATPIIEALNVRAKQEPRLTVVPPAASAEVLQVLPISSSDPYRATDEQIESAWRIIDQHTERALVGAAQGP